MNRRDFHKTSGAFMLSYLVGGAALSLSPATAQAQKVPLQILTLEEAELLNLLADAIVPGARSSGLSHYIDHQLASSLPDSMLILKYLGVPAPHVNFYRAALKAVQSSLTDRSPEGLNAYITTMAQSNPTGWQDAPPAPFFYFVLRSDSVDVTYGTREGFDKLDIPYMAHIAPPSRSWS